MKAWRLNNGVKGGIGLLLSVWCMGPMQGAQALTERSAWRFKVFYDGKDIGEHRFQVARSGGKQSVEISADFNVKFLGVNVYHYRHINHEVWADGCLESMQARTQDGGDQLSVSAAKTAQGLKAISTGKEALLHGCVMSFAYWNPEFLGQHQLLNSQTGEYLPVTIREVAKEPLKLGQKSVPAVRYKLTGKEIDIDLWYADNREWLRLESDLKGSRVVYELVD